MTQTMTKDLVLFEDGPQQAYFDLDDARDIVCHGMAQGVPMFIYRHNNIEWFNENCEEIEDFLNQWVDDTYGSGNAISQFGEDCSTILELKEKLVWAYVEIKCYQYLVENDPNY